MGCPLITRLGGALLERLASRRRRTLEHVWRTAADVQAATLHRLVARARDTEFGRDHDLTGICSVADYQARVPLRSYLDFRSLWMLLLFEHVARRRDLETCWPDLRVFIHGGVAFAPYYATFEEWLGRRLEYVEVYPASEGFVAVQTEPSGGLTLMLDYDIFYEFVPVEDLGEARPRRVTVADVELGPAYAVVLTTPAGLWSYMLGDTVRFIARDPLRLVITGRTRHFVNGVGENVIVEEVERALQGACGKVGGEVVEFTVAPRYPTTGEARGGHDWLVEFRMAPGDVRAFARALDETLMTLNTDYRIKRRADLGMLPPRVIPLPAGSFHRWLRQAGKLGDQHKVPRATNDRTVADGLLRTLA